MKSDMSRPLYMVEILGSLWWPIRAADERDAKLEASRVYDISVKRITAVKLIKEAA